MMTKEDAWEIILEDECADDCEMWDAANDYVHTGKPCTCGYADRLIEAENWVNENDPI